MLDAVLLRERMRPGSEWAKASGARLADIRERRGWHQRDLAGLVGVPFETIWKAEKGDLLPRDYLRVAIAQALACDVNEIWPWPTKEWVAEVACQAVA